MRGQLASLTISISRREYGILTGARICKFLTWNLPYKRLASLQGPWFQYRFFVVANHLDSCRIIQSFPNTSPVFFSTPRCLVTKISLKAFKGTKFLAFSGLSPSCCSLLPWSSQANRSNPVVNLDNDMWQCNVKMTTHDLWKESLHLFSIVGYRLMYKLVKH